jgi:hypothetical protein
MTTFNLFACAGFGNVLYAVPNHEPVPAHIVRPLWTYAGQTTSLPGQQPRPRPPNRIHGRADAPIETSALERVA